MCSIMAGQWLRGLVEELALELCTERPLLLMLLCLLRLPTPPSSTSKAFPPVIWVTRTEGFALPVPDDLDTDEWLWLRVCKQI